MFSGRNFIENWNTFFFRPEPVIKEGIFRIIWGIILLIYISQDFINIESFYGPYGIISLKSSLNQFFYPHINLFQYFGNTIKFTYLIYGLFFLSTLTFIIGYKTRTSIILIIISMVTIHQRNIWLLSSSEVLLRIITIYLLFSNCGKSLSLDAYFHNKKAKLPFPEESSPWIMRLIQIQLSVVYVWTVWQKLRGETWFDGSALYYATRLDQFKNFPVPLFFDSIFLLKIGTWGTLLLELFLGTLIWFKEFRRPLIVVGIIFHILIEYSMSIPFFEYIMISLLFTHYTGNEFKEWYFKIAVYLRWKLQNLRETKPTVS
jgi:hypothetical protein